MNSPIVCDTPEKINAFHMLALKGALKLESLGMKRRGVSAKIEARMILVAAGKKNIPRNAQQLLPVFVEYLRENGILA